MADESLQTLTCVKIPNPDGVIIGSPMNVSAAGRKSIPAVATETNGVNWIGVVL
jgi:hypothetical protein